MVAFLAMTKAWISLVEGGEGLYLPNCQSNLIIAPHALTLLFFIYTITTAYHFQTSSTISCRVPRLRENISQRRP